MNMTARLFALSFAAFALCANADVVAQWQNVAVNYGDAGWSQNMEDIHLRDDNGKSAGDATHGLLQWLVNDEADTSTIIKASAGENYLSINAPWRSASALERTIAGRTDSLDDRPVVLVDSTVYFDATVHLTPSRDIPEPSEKDKITFWYANGNGDLSEGLYAYAGAFNNSLQYPIRQIYRFELPATFDAYEWNRLTVKTIPDITKGGKVLGFVAYMNEQPLKVEGDYPLFADFDGRRLLSDDVLQIYEEKRLLPSMTMPGSNDSVSFMGMAFAGKGDVSSIGTADSPASDLAFTAESRNMLITWDVGVAGFFILDANGKELAHIETNTYPDGRYTFNVGNTAVLFKIDALGYKSGFSAGDLFPEGFTFDENGNMDLPVGTDDVGLRITSSRSIVSVGENSFSTFKEAMANAAEGTNTIVLDSDVTISTENIGGYNDKGALEVTDGEWILDLAGHTLKGGSDKYATIRVWKNGKLTIIDSSVEQTGRVKPYAVGDYETLEPGITRWAVSNYRSTGYEPSLTINGGIFDGDVTNFTQFAEMSIDCLIAGGSFASTETDAFPLVQYAEDSTYFTYNAGYWSIAAQNAFIWCGKGENDLWSNPENWQRKAVPGADDTAIFPATDEVWTVDMEEGFECRHLQIDGFVSLSGVNDFSEVTIDAFPLAISGTARMEYNGTLPPEMTFLSGDWAGTVAISGLTARPVSLSAIGSWGTEYSVVEFNGVYGAINLIDGINLPYELSLVDADEIPAWRNQAGHTGSIIRFAKLSGNGTLVSNANIIENNQVLQFLDVADFTGKFDIAGKRVLLGEGEIRTPSVASISWLEGVIVRKGAVHSCATAYFADNFSVIDGAIDDCLVNFTAVATGVEQATVSLLPAANSAGLYVLNGAVYIGEASEPPPSEVGQPVIASINRDSATGVVTVTVEESEAGLWYGLLFVADLKDAWPTTPVNGWTAGNGDDIQLSAPATNPNGFYRVVVTDVNPDTEQK